MPSRRPLPDAQPAAGNPAEAGRLAAADLLATQPAPTPLLIPAISFAVGIAIADQFTGLPSLATNTLAIALVVGVWLMLALVAGRAARWARWSALALGLALCGLMRMQAAQSFPADHIKHHLPEDPIPARLTGIVATPPRTSAGLLHSPFYPRRPDPNVRFMLSVTEADSGSDSVALSGLVQVTVRPAQRVPVALGDPVTVTGWLRPTAPPLNPGGFDWQQWQARRGVFAQLSVDAIDYLLPADGVGAFGMRWQRDLRSWARQLLYGDSAPDDARQLLDVLVLGQRSAADQELNERFIRLGAAPYLAVSGFHVGVLALTVAMLGRLFLSRERTAWLVLVVLLAYLMIVEPNPPVLRATLMGVLASIAVILRRPAATLNWWAASGLILLLINPQSLFDIGFQFTFAMVLVLLTVWPALDLWLRGFGNEWDQLERWETQEANTLLGIMRRRSSRVLLGTVGVAATLWLASLPIVGLYFGRFAPFGFLGNLLIGPVVIVTIWASVLGLALNALLTPLGISVDLAGNASSMLLAWTQWLDQGIGTRWEMSHIPWPLALVSYTPALFWPLLRARRLIRTQGIWRPVALKTGSVLACLLLPSVVFWSAWAFLPQRSIEPGIDLLAISRGSGTLVHTGSDTLLIDGGTLSNWDASNAIRDYLRQIDSPPLAGAILTGQTAGYFSAWPNLNERDSFGWVDLGPALAIDSFAIRRLQKEIGDLPRLTLPKEYELGQYTITPYATISGKRALLLEFGEARLLYALALSVDEFAAVMSQLSTDIAPAPLTAVIAPARSGPAIQRVLGITERLGARLIIFHLPSDEPAWGAAQRHAAETMTLYNVWDSGAVRLSPDMTNPAVWAIEPLSRRATNRVR